MQLGFYTCTSSLTIYEIAHSHLQTFQSITYDQDKTGCVVCQYSSLVIIDVLGKNSNVIKVT